MLVSTAEAIHTLKAGATEVSVQPWQNGVSIVHDGVSITMGSSMVVTKPPWTPHYYLGPSHDVLNAAKVEEIPDGQRIVLEHKGAREVFTGTDTITVYNDGRVERHLAGTFNEAEGEALIQWRAAAINPVLIIGRPYAAKLQDGSKRSGIVSVTPLSPKDNENELARGLSEISFESRIGPIRITADSKREITCYDHRGSRWANPAKPLFWFGDLGTRFKQGDPIEYRITYHLPAAQELGHQPLQVDSAAKTAKTPQAQTIATGERPMLIPQPKSVAWGEGEFVVPAGKHLDDVIKAETIDDAAFSAEGYRLLVSDAGVVARARTEAGHRHARRTLAQLATAGSDGRTTVPHVTIEDYPSLAFRGVHAFTGGKGPDLHLKLFKHIVADLKMNHLVLESEYIEWDAYPELHHPAYGMPKSDVEQILKLCAAEGVEVSPLVMSLGHCQWMFETTDKFLHLAEDPEAKWAYCVTNPETYEFIFTIYQEAVDLFKPRFFHIGHDEYADRGRVPYRESSEPYTIEQLFMMDTMRHHEWFTERDIRIMMWGDMLLAKGEAPDATNAKSVEQAVRMRDELPDDIVITDWHYVETEPEKYTSLKIFQDEGHDTIASTWSRHGNIVNFAKAAADNESMGLLQTTWAGYSLDPASFEREMHQYVAWVVAAEAGWNADRPLDHSNFLAGEHFLRLMGMTSLEPANRAGWLLNLKSLGNYPLAAEDAEGWFGLGPDYDLSSLPTGRVRLRGVEFIVPNRVPVLMSKLTRGEEFPFRAEMFTNTKAKTLVFLHATNYACRDGATVGRYEVERQDGSIARIPLRYGENIMAYDDISPAADAPLMWHGQTKAGRPIGVRALIWDNVYPDVPIRAIRARSQNAAGALMWLSVTGLNDAPADGESAQ